MSKATKGADSVAIGYVQEVVREKMAGFVAATKGATGRASTVQAWAVRDPHKQILIQSVSLRKDSCISSVSSRSRTWASLYEAGYRCVRVTITEEPTDE